MFCCVLPISLVQLVVFKISYIVVSVAKGSVLEGEDRIRAQLIDGVKLIAAECQLVVKINKKTVFLKAC